MHIERVARDSLKRINLSGYVNEPSVSVYPYGGEPHAVRLWLKDDGLSVILHLSDLERIAAVIAEHGTPALKAATALPEPPTAPTRPPGTAERYREQAAGLLPRMPLPDHLRRKE